MVIGDVEWNLRSNASWSYTVSRLYQEPDVIAAVERLAAAAQAKNAACVYESYCTLRRLKRVAKTARRVLTREKS
jgi:hypothetical protein